MKLEAYKVFIVTLALASVCIIHADTYGEGGSDSQLDILSMGADVTYFGEPGGFNFPTLTGNGTAGATRYFNGTDYFNTNSFSRVQTGNGTAYQESTEGTDLFFSNSSSQAEDVTAQWQGFVTSTSYSSSPNASSWDAVQSYVIYAQDNGTSASDFAEFTTASYGTLTGTSSGSLTFTVVVPGGAASDFLINTEAYNESYSQATPEPASMLPLGLGIVILFRRRNKRPA